MATPAADRAVDTEHREALARARTVSHLFDDAIRIPGTQIRFGLDPVLGILPVSGDAVAAIGSLYIVLKGVELGAPPALIAKMLAYIAGDFLVGSIPLVGPVIDASWKANKRNVELLESYVESTASDDRSLDSDVTGT